MSRFHPDLYQLYRPFYPPETFAGLRERLAARRGVAPYRIADIGCGTGHSALSLLRTGIPAHLIAVDPDPGMLAAARTLIDFKAHVLEFREGRGEETGLEAGSVDAILVGSALHWMDAPRAREEFVRILRPRGLLRVFEYQFPKALNSPELNEWIRRQFNLYWKAPRQRPRGDFAQVTAVFRDDSLFELVEERKPPMLLSLGVDEVTGLVLSQSRVLHYEEALAPAARDRFRRDVRAELADRMGEAPCEFDFKLAWAEFAL